MKDFSQYKDYELSEKDIDSALNYLRIFEPKNATPKNAIDFLEFLRVGIHEIAHEKPEKLEELYKKFVAER